MIFLLLRRKSGTQLSTLVILKSFFLSIPEVQNIITLSLNTSYEGQRLLMRGEMGIVGFEHY